MALTQTQIDALLALSRNGRPAVAAYWKVVWDAGDSAETRYYGESAFKQTAGFFGIGVDIEARIIGSVLKDLQFEINPDLRTEEIPIVFDDIDKVIKGRFQTFGSGVAVELIYYYPDVNGSLSAWFGQLQAPQVYGWKQLETKATNGFRSRELLLPGSNHPIDHCRFTFGGQMPSFDAVRTNGCPYDRHLGGATGNFISGTTPYTDCPRDKASCVARLGDDISHPLYYGGFECDVAPVVTDPDTGYLARTQGNASNLIQPLRVTAGTKYMRALPILLWRRDPNDHPDSGWFDVIWDAGEGPNSAITNFKVNEKLIPSNVLKIRLGTRGQAQIGYAPNIPHYSSTCVIWTRYGQVNPNDYSPSTVSAECLIVGNKEVVGFNQSGGTLGAVHAQFFSDTAWTDQVDERSVYNIDFPATTSPPTPLAWSRFSSTYSGTITWPTTGVKIIDLTVIGGVRMTLNGSLFIDQLAPSTGGSHLNSFSATAGVPYTFLIEFVRNPVTFSSSTWELILKSDGTVIPNSWYQSSAPAATFYRSWTDDRIRWLAECMSNQKWGMRYSLATRFHVDSWKHAETTKAQYVTYTHTFPDGETKPFTGRASTFNAILEGRPCAEQITDICRSGGIFVPFQHEGQFYLKPARPASTAELASARIFTDTGQTRNIVWEGGQPLIEPSQVPNDKIVNEIVLRYEEGTNFDIERPITVNDPNQQRLAGRALGDNNLQRVPMNFTALGVRHLQEAVRVAYRILKFGEFDEGGIENNLRVRFVTFFEQTIGLLRYDWIKIVSETLDGFTIGTDNGAVDHTETPQYFRILEMNKLANGRVEILSQAYNHTAYTAFEAPLYSPTVPGGDPGIPLPSPNPQLPPPTLPPVTPTPSEPLPGTGDPGDRGPIVVALPTDYGSASFTDLTYDATLGVIEVEVSS